MAPIHGITLRKDMPNWAGLSGSGSYVDLLKDLFYKSSLGPGAYQTIMSMLSPDAWKRQYLIGRDQLGLERGSAAHRLAEIMAGRGTYGQGPYAQAYKSLEGQYAGALSQLLGQSQQYGIQNAMAMLQALLNLTTQGKGMDLYKKQADRSWMSSLFGGLGEGIGALLGSL